MAGEWDPVCYALQTLSPEYLPRSALAIFRDGFNWSNYAIPAPLATVHVGALEIHPTIFCDNETAYHSMKLQTQQEIWCASMIDLE
jgi:hypothetical protein